MKIKENSGITNNKRFRLLLNSFFLRRKITIALIGSMAAFLGIMAAFIIGAYTYKTGLFTSMWIPVKYTLQIPLAPFDYVESLLEPVDHLNIDIDYLSYQKLAYARKQALEELLLDKVENQYQKVKIRYNGKTVSAKIRLKGGIAKDHLSGKKWSFRVVIKGKERLFGMKNFALMSPNRRGLLHTWFLRTVMRQEGIISKRYMFVDLSINGKNHGIYAIDEHFDKTMLSFNKRKESVFIRLAQEPLFFERAAWNAAPYKNDDYYYAFDVDTFKYNSVIKNQDLSQLFNKARILFEGFRRDELTTSQVFDIKKMAKWMAISDVLGAWHGFSFNNMRFYYNPYTSKLEPVPDDSFNERPFNRSIDRIFRLNDWYNTGKFLRQVFSDMEFMRLYIEELDRVTTKQYMDMLLEKNSDEIDHLVKVLRKDEVSFSFNNSNGFFGREQFYIYQKLIREMIYPYKGVQAFVNSIKDDMLILDIGVNKTLPMEILHVKNKNSEIFKPIGQTKPLNRIILSGNGFATPVVYESIQFIIPKGRAKSEILPEELQVAYRVLGTSKVLSSSVSRFQSFNKALLKQYAFSKKPNIEKFTFVKVNLRDKEIRISRGNYEISEDIIVPRGFTFILEPGTELNLINGSLILSYSQVIFNGTSDNPVVIYSADGTGQGLTVLEVEKKSILENVIFNNLSAVSKNGWDLTAPVNFYRSPVYVKNTIFKHNLSGDDYLNIVHSEFYIDQSQFIDTFSDCLDLDFSDGKILNSFFIRCGIKNNNGDGIDLSGSKVFASNITMKQIGDKGLSVGENSFLTANNIKISKATNAIAVKDSSQFSGEKLIIQDSQRGVLGFKKKPEFGSVKIDIIDIEMDRVITKYLIEEGSQFSINGDQMKTNSFDLKEKLYPITEP
jgi:hypothetical protein